MNAFLNRIGSCIPDNPSGEIPWEQLLPLLSACGFSALQQTPQDPIFHGEGNVYTHTQMVCRALTGMPEFHQLPPRQKTELFLAAVLHDIGKAVTTRSEDGRWVSPHHASAGSLIARAFLWRNCGLGGTADSITFRETVCTLIRFHMIPHHLTDREDPERTARKIAACGELAPDFTWELLLLLAKADALGRCAEDIEDMLLQVQLSELTAQEASCLTCAYPFPNRCTEHAYLTGRNVLPELSLYDASWGEVIVLSGLPGTGKDAWIRQHHPDLPMISPDEIRKALHVKPTADQGAVFQEAHERARGFLRSKLPFVWNATNLTTDTRQRVIGLCQQYGARVRIVYLETDWLTRRERNAGRTAEVPEDAVERMLGKTVLPTPDEAQVVEWFCV